MAGREYLFPSYHNQQEYVRTEKEVKKKNDEAMRIQAEKEAQEAQERKAQQAVSDVITERGEAFKSLGANCQISNRMANYLKGAFAGNEEGLEAYLAESLRVSQEMRQLSTVKFGERSAELIKQGWQQFSDHPNVWYPPLAREPLSPSEAILRELKLRIGNDRFGTWFGRNYQVCVEESRVVIEVEYPHSAKYIRETFRREVWESVREVLKTERQPYVVAAGCDLMSIAKPIASGATVPKIGDVLPQLQPALAGC